MAAMPARLLRSIRNGCAALLWLPLAAFAAPSAELVTLPVRDNVTETYLLVADHATPVDQIVLLFSGGSGQVKLRPISTTPAYAERGNFLVRTRYLWASDGFAAAVVDVPSDRQGSGLDDQFRLSQTHADDIAKLIADLHRRFPDAKLTLVGTSRGTVSAASVAGRVAAGIDKVVLTSTLFNASRNGGAGLAGFDYGRIKVPLLFVHHADDACAVTPYSGARQQSASYPLISVHGGKPAESGECDPLAAHGYFGKEGETVNAIKHWIAGQSFASEIN
jgi:pimeloyl-ACP methyl ester carboxylesterase